jgi:hypothetical protein
MPTFTTGELTALISALISLFAVFFGPLITSRIAKKQILSPIRQKWIDELRELMSQHLSECEKAIVIHQGDGIFDTEKTDEALFQKLLYLKQKLGLMLNPSEKEHANLIEKIDELNDEVMHGVDDFIKFGAKLRATTALCQEILKGEWDKVKKGKM